MWGSLKKIRLESFGHIWTNANMSAVHDLIEVDMYRLDSFGSCSVSDSFRFHHPGTIGQYWLRAWGGAVSRCERTSECSPPKLRYSNMSMLIA